jgi:3-hydroxyacyl-[acyl-carrier-protein] dehydratase
MMTNATRQMGYSEIQHWLRHRFPMVMVDRITEYEPGRYVHAQTAVSGTSDWAQGHFPGRAIYPGSHIIQAFSQTAILLLQLSSSQLTDDELTVVSSLEARFKGIVVPGDLLTFNTFLDRVASDVFFFHGVANRDRTPIASLRVRIARRPLSAFGKALW